MGDSPKDTRDSKTWVVFELTHFGEKTAVTGELEKHIRDTFHINESQYFIPYRLFICDGRRTIFNVMEGYCFVEYTLDARDYVLATLNSLYLRNVLHTKSNYQYTLHTIPNSNVEDLREKLIQMAVSTLTVGDRVRILRGTYEGLTGEVLSLTEKEACIHIKLRSLEAVRMVPRYALTLIGGEDE